MLKCDNAIISLQHYRIAALQHYRIFTKIMQELVRKTLSSCYQYRMPMYSRIAFIACAGMLLYATICFYPKWKQGTTEATLSWDVSGYYLYLPAFFIYKDSKQLKFMPEILEKYRPTHNFQQAFRHEASGNYVLKYSCGQAVLYAPFFALAHLIAQQHPDYLADGFSLPYQMGITFGSLFIALLGLWFLRKILLEFFEDKTVAATLLLLVAATNYLEYAGITNAMSHNWLFTLHSLLIWYTIRFHRQPSYALAASIGACIGLAALTRPTEIIVALIPLLWGLEGLRWEYLNARLNFLKIAFPKIILAALVCIAIGSLQLWYWKYATGDFIVYSYEEQGFSWLRPHLWKGFMSYRAGWLIYTPTMIFALLGFRALYREYYSLFWVALAYVALHIYITFAWDIWWYGGSLGQRAMIQAYPILSLPLAAFISQIWKTKFWKYLVLALALFFTAYNFWLTQQARPGKLLRPGEMSGAYLREILFQQDAPIEAQKLLDTREQFKGERQAVHPVLKDNFDTQPVDSIFFLQDPATSNTVIRLYKEQQYSSIISVAKSNIPEDSEWLRVQADYYALHKEWETWRMTQLVVRFWDEDKNVKTRYIRLHRLLKDATWKTIWLDMRLPKQPFTRVEVRYWNASSDKTIFVDNFIIESFME